MISLKQKWQRKRNLNKGYLRRMIKYIDMMCYGDELADYEREFLQRTSNKIGSILENWDLLDNPH